MALLFFLHCGDSIMKRPLVGITVCFLGGILLTHYFSFWACIFIFVAIMLGSVFYAFYSRHTKKLPSFPIWIMVSALVLGSFSPRIYDKVHTAPFANLSSAKQSITLQLTELTNSIDYTDSSTTSFYYKAALKTVGAQKKKGTIFLAINGGKSRTSPYKIGDVIQLKGSLTPLPVSTSYGVRDQSIYGKTQGIYYRIRTQSNEVKVLYHQNTPSYYLNQLRKAVCEKIDQHFILTESSLLKALLIGDRTDIPSYISQSFQRSGTAHILALSGLHVSIFLMLFMYLFSFLHMKRRTRNFFCIGFLCFFVIFAGATPSIIRAVFCSSILLISINLGEEEDRLTTLAFSALILLIFNPYTLFDMSFLLSYLSILGIYCFYPLLTKKFHAIKQHYIRSSLAMSLASQIFILPILMFNFGSISLIGIISNLLIVGILFLLIVFGISSILLSSVPLIGAICINICRLIIRYILWVTLHMQSFPVLQLPFHFSNTYWLILYGLCIMGIYWLLSHRCPRMRRLSLSLVCFLMITMSIWQIVSKNVIISFVNVGQGDGAVIAMPHNHYVLLDGGGKTYEIGTDQGEKSFIPFLKKSNIQTVDYAILSHFDSDHALGILHALTELKVKTLLLPYRSCYNDDLSLQILSAAAKRDIPILYLKKGDSFSLAKDMKLTVLSPDESVIKDENRASLICKITYGKTSCLFTGDAPSTVLESLPKQAIKSTIVKVSHHGSKTGASQTFYQNCQAEYALIGVGKNSYGHPSKEILSLLKSENIMWYQTDQYGDITMTISLHHLPYISTYLKGNIL